jgi:hypothetical protein
MRVSNTDPTTGTIHFTAGKGCAAGRAVETGGLAGGNHPAIGKAGEQPAGSFGNIAGNTQMAFVATWTGRAAADAPLFKQAASLLQCSTFPADDDSQTHN